MTLNQLRYFVTVAESGHLTRSAAELMISQPSLSQAVRKLEKELGFPLFSSKGRTLLLTKEGEAFLPYAREVLRSGERAEHAAHNIALDRRGLIRFMHTEPLPRYFIPDLIRGFLEQEKDQDVRIESDIAGTGKIADALLRDEITFGFCSDLTPRTEGLTMYPLIEQPIVLVAARSDPLCSLPLVTPQDLAGRPCISYGPGSALQQQLDSCFSKWNIRPDICYRSSAVQINNLVAQGLGWAFIVRTDETVSDRITVLNMPELTLRRRTCLAVRTGRMLSSAAERFRDYVLEYAAAMRQASNGNT
jgi:DNA-binding transcriptional LysR family regulator